MREWIKQNYTEWLIVRFYTSLKRAGDDCWEWQGARLPAGYGRLKVQGVITGAHVVSYRLHCGVVPIGMVVCHKCDNPSCVNPQHLFLGTYSDNAKDMCSKGRDNPPRGSNNAQAKLREEHVREIRRRHALGGLTHQDLAQAYGVSRASISMIVNRKSWRHISEGTAKCEK